MLAPGSSCSHCQWQRPGTPRRTGGGWAARGNAGMAALGTQGSRQELVLGPGLGADSAEMQPAARTVVCHRRSHLNASHMRPQPARDSQRPYARALMHEKHVTAMKKRRPSWYSSTEDYGRICTVEYYLTPWDAAHSGHGPSFGPVPRRLVVATAAVRPRRRSSAPPRHTLRGSGVRDSRARPSLEHEAKPG